MTFTQSIRSVISQYAVFAGRASRSEYWYWILGLVLVSIVLSIVEGALVAPLLGFEPFAEEAGQPLNWLFSLIIFIPTLAVAARRLHDMGRSGWWLLIQIIPIVGALVLLWWLTRPSDAGENAYGAAPGTA